MKFRSVVQFACIVGAAGIGAGLGAAAAGIVALVLGQAFRPDSPWLTGLPVLGVLGAGLGAGVAHLTRHWLVPATPNRRYGDRHRMLLFIAAGLVVVPLATAVGQLSTPAVAVPLMLIGAAVTVTLWMRALRRQRSRPHPHPAARATR